MIPAYIITAVTIQLVLLIHQDYHLFFGDCLLNCAAKHYGFEDLVAREIIAAASIPISKMDLGIPVIGASSETTNIASYLW